jgi:hypothetical protein
MFLGYENLDRPFYFIILPALSIILSLFPLLALCNKARDTTVPQSILYLPFLLCRTSSFNIGYGTKTKPDAIVASGFAIMIAITVFSVLNLDGPHHGLTIGEPEQNILALQNMFNRH